MEDFDHGIPDNKYNKHTWIAGNPEIGDQVWIGTFCLIDALYAPLKIGRGCDISSGVQILTHSTVKRCISERRFGKIESAATEIGKFCFIGTNAVILKGVTVGHHSVIAAGAVVTEGSNIPPYSIVAGVPAKIIGSSRKFLKDIDKEAISVVIPAYNEAANIENVVREAVNALDEFTKDYEIVLINDGSTDRTGEIIDRMVAKNKRVRALHHKTNKGFTGAMKTSFKNAKNHLIFLAPADGQFNFNELELFVESIRGYDIAIGYRVANEESFLRQLNSKLFHILCKLFFGIKFKEISTVSLWRRRVIESIAIESSDRSAMFLPEIVYKALQKKYKFTEVPIHWRIRKGGKAKGANPGVILKTLIEMVKLWQRIHI